MTMTARRIRGDWWADFRYEGKRIRKKSPVNNKRGAEEYERVLRTRLVNGESLDGRDNSCPRYEDFATEWLGTYVVANNKPSEVATKRSILGRHLLPFFGNFRLDQICVQSIEQYKAQKLREGLSAKRINNTLTVLRRSLVIASEWRQLEVVPAFRWLKAPKPVFDFFIKEESERLLKVTPPEHYAMICTALMAGLRRGELLGLRWEDVDLVSRKLHVRRSQWRGVDYTPKSGRSRVVPMCETLVLALRQHRHLRGPYVFCNDNGSALTADQIKRIVPTACRRAGLRQVKWHVLRHSFASQLAMAAVPLKAIQELLGHATIEMTMRYAHLAPSTLEKAVAVFDGSTESGHYLGTKNRSSL